MAASMIYAKEELDLFLGARYQTSVESSQYVTLYPISGINSTGCEFVLSASRDHYLDLTETLIETSGRITLPDGTDIADTAPVFPVNLLGPSLWNEVEVSYNGQLMSNTNTMHASKCMIETMLNYGVSAKKSHLSAGMYFKDYAPDLNDLSEIKKVYEKDGALRRHALVAESRSVNMIHPLHVDIFKTNKLLLSGIEVRIRLTRNKDAYVLMAPDATTKFKFEIDNCVLMIRQVKPTESTSLALEKTLLQSDANYHVTRVIMRNFAIPKGTVTTVKDNLLNSIVPKRLALALTTSTAFVGAYDENPHYFSHKDLASVSLDVNGKSMMPVKVNFDAGEYAAAYYMQFIALNKHQQDRGTDIAIDEFHNNFVLAWDLTPDCSGEEGIKYVDNMGNVRLNLSFHNALPVTLAAIIYAEVDGTILISSNRKIVRDYV